MYITPYRPRLSDVDAPPPMVINFQSFVTSSSYQLIFSVAELPYRAGIDSSLSCQSIPHVRISFVAGKAALRRHSHPLQCLFRELRRNDTEDDVLVGWIFRIVLHFIH